MEQNAYEALFLGVNVFVFIIALTAGILLMTSLMNMVNYANENAVVGMNGSLAESVGIVNERIYTGSELITYYNNFVESICKAKEKNEDITTRYYVRTSKTGQEQRIDKYITGQYVNCTDIANDDIEGQYITGENFNNYYNKKFELLYKGKNNNIQEYVFVMINE